MTHKVYVVEYHSLEDDEIVLPARPFEWVETSLWVALLHRAGCSQIESPPKLSVSIFAE